MLRNHRKRKLRVFEAHRYALSDYADFTRDDLAFQMRNYRSFQVQLCKQILDPLRVLACIDKHGIILFLPPGYVLPERIVQALNTQHILWDLHGLKLDHCVGPYQVIAP